MEERQSAKVILKGIRQRDALLAAMEEDEKRIHKELAGLEAAISHQYREELREKLEQCEESLLKEKVHMIAMKEQGKELIGKLADPQEQAILYNRYINAMSWNRICKTMNYSWSGMFKLEHRALKNVDEILKKSE
jgi:DNA-directed RNA polymerase specialized sigma subunit